MLRFVYFLSDLTRTVKRLALNSTCIRLDQRFSTDGLRPSNGSWKISNGLSKKLLLYSFFVESEIKPALRKVNKWPKTSVVGRRIFSSKMRIARLFGLRNTGLDYVSTFVFSFKLNLNQTFVLFCFVLIIFFLYLSIIVKMRTKKKKTQ